MINSNDGNQDHAEAHDMINKRIKWSIITVTTIAIIVFFIGIAYEANALFTYKKELVKEHVDIVYSILTYYNGLYVNGDISFHQAQSDAKNLIKSLRYDQNNYFWINTTDCILIVNPVTPEYEGLYRCDIMDKTGIPFYSKIIEAATGPNKEGYVCYVGAKLGLTETKYHVTKTSYVKMFEPWGWIVGSGFFEEEVIEDLIQKSTFYGILYGIFSGLVIITILFNLTPSLKIIHRCNRAVKDMLQGEHVLNLKDDNRVDELGELAKNLLKLSKFICAKYGNCKERISLNKDFFNDNSTDNK